jgi:glyoxylase-like metal-dependent hydrolase (beta-lactamase superfamily II)
MAGARLLVGNMEVLALTDRAGDFPFPLGQLFPDVPAEAWTPFVQRFPELFSGSDCWHNHYICYILRSRGRTILVDTGVGSQATNPGLINTLFAGVDGRLMTELFEAGVNPEEVDTVFLTHLHPDHVGWNISRQGSNPQPTFPRARYIAHQADWQTFAKPEVQALFPFQYWQETLGPLETLGVLDLFAGECTLTDEIKTIHLPGHTPGHAGLALESGGQRALIMGDLAIHPAQIAETEWSSLFDMDRELAAKIRRQEIDRVETENIALLGCHFPEPGYGHLVREETRRYWKGF